MRRRSVQVGFRCGVLAYAAAGWRVYSESYRHSENELVQTGAEICGLARGGVDELRAAELRIRRGWVGGGGWDLYL